VTTSPFNEMMYYDTLGFLYPFDVRHQPDDRAFCNPYADGRVTLRLHSEHGFDEGVLVYNEGKVQAEPLRCFARDERFLYWEASIRPARQQFTYSFALKHSSGRAVYVGRPGVTHVVETPFTLDLADLPPMETPAWMHGAIIYQIFPERFANAEPANDPEGVVPWDTPPQSVQFQGGDLQGITANLDHIQELGVDALYLNPINRSPSNHHYNASNFLQVDPALGGDAALHELVEAVHERGMRLILDASFNHCDPTFFAFQDLLENGRHSRYRDWFTVYDYPLRIRYREDSFGRHHHLQPDAILPYLKRISAYTGLPLEAASDEGPPIEPTYNAWFGVLTMPQFDLSNPETRAYFLHVAAYWLREFDVDGWRMDVVQHVADDFWPEFRQVCKAVRPDCYLLAEVWGDTSSWLQDSFDATMNYTFYHLCREYFARADLETAAFVDGITRMLAGYAPQVNAVNQNLLSSHDVPRFVHEAGERPERLRLALLFQFTIPGAPSVYYGDEVGVSGGQDPDNRRAFPWNEQDSWDQKTLAQVKELARLRHAYPALRYGGWQPVWTGDEAFAFVRAHEGQRVLVVVNRDEESLTIRLPLSGAPQRLWGSAEIGAEDGEIILRALPGWSGVIVAL